jgi:ankyrin repeat protein|tara:strand:- start:150 stop:491 length:342 start_codon:yes stop_codon:yes gene_type:complete
MITSANNLFSFAQLLVEAGASLNPRNTKGSTALHFASLKLIKDHGDAPPRRPKDQAVRVIKLYIEHGADLNVQNLKGETPVWIAAIKGAVEATRLLIEAGCVLDLKTVQQRPG